MSLKENIDQEKNDLLKNKKPYETAAFIIFAVLFVQQIAFLLYRVIDFFVDMANPLITTAYFSQTSLTTPVFFGRIINISSSSVVVLLLAIVALVFWYYLIYLLVFRYCAKHGYAKWTWTALVVFGPTIFLIPPYIIFAAYVFRPYLFRFIKRGVQEFKEYNKDKPLPEESTDN